MKVLFPYLLFLILVLVSGCVQQADNPLKSVGPNPGPEEMPSPVQSLLDRYNLSDSTLFSREFLPTQGNPPSLFDTSYDIYAMVFLWGRLMNTGNFNVPVTTNWDGSLSINAVAAIVPVAAIHFESGQDSLVTQTIPTVLPWGSTTSSADFDGVGCLLFVKRGVVYLAAPMLTIATPPFTTQYSMDQLVRLSAYYKIDSINSVAAYARRIGPYQCRQGLMVGQWIKDDLSGQSGTFGGQWLDENGNVSGVFAGSFFTRDDSLHLFTGTISHPMLNLVIAQMNGIFYYDDPRMCPMCGTGFGKMKGIFKYTNQSGGGALVSDLTEMSIGSVEMTLKGTWREFCITSNDDNSAGTK